MNAQFMPIAQFAIFYDGWLSIYSDTNEIIAVRLEMWK